MQKYISLYPIKKKAYSIDEEGNIYSHLTNKYLIPKEDKDGYMTIGLSCEENRRKFFKVHRLVLSTFSPVENMENLQVNHINGNKKDNSISNLEWCTGKENIKHAVENNLRGKGRAEITEKEVIEICKLLEQGYAPKMVAQKLYPEEVEKYTSIIYGIKRKKNWIKISCNYNIDAPYKYGSAFRSSYTIWELENICVFVRDNKDNMTPTQMASKFFGENLSYTDSRCKLFGDISRKQKYTNISKYFF